MILGHHLKQRQNSFQVKKNNIQFTFKRWKRNIKQDSLYNFCPQARFFLTICLYSFTKLSVRIYSIFFDSINQSWIQFQVDFLYLYTALLHIGSFFLLVRNFLTKIGLVHIFHQVSCKTNIKLRDIFPIYNHGHLASQICECQVIVTAWWMSLWFYKERVYKRAENLKLSEIYWTTVILVCLVAFCVSTCVLSHNRYQLP